MRLLRAPLRELLQIIGIEDDSSDLTELIELPESRLEDIQRSRKISVGQINIRTDPPTAFFKKFKIQTTESKYFILVITETGPALLIRDPETRELPFLSELPQTLQKYFTAKQGGALERALERRRSKLVKKNITPK
jgi:hypothetical protein